jgi:hypothetical protein
MSVLAVLLALLAVAVAGIGALYLTQATTGVGIIGLACFLGILARLAQASGHHRELREAISQRADSLP